MKILYICTHNRCRSILSEAITNDLGQGVLEAKSAGSQPSGQVHPLSLQYLEEAGISSIGLKSQSWDEFEDFEADVVVTVCDSVAGEACPVWFGNSIKVHWGLEDPSKIEGTEDQKAEGFRACIAEVSRRVEELVAIAKQGLTNSELRTALANLGAK